MKLLLYCTKAKPDLVDDRWEYENNFSSKKYNIYNTNERGSCGYTFNGKIVAECDYEVEWCDTSWFCSDFIEHKGLEKSCLTKEQLFDYVKGKNEFYAIHIKNLHIFDEPKELGYTHLTRAPQNMCYGWTLDNEYLLPDPCIVVSIRPEWLCKILNGEKTIEVRKKILKEMIK